MTHSLIPYASYLHVIFVSYLCNKVKETMLNCLRGLEKYDLLKYSHQRSWRFTNDGDLINQPYIEMIKNAGSITFTKID